MELDVAAAVPDSVTLDTCVALAVAQVQLLPGAVSLEVAVPLTDCVTLDSHVAPAVAEGELLPAVSVGVEEGEGASPREGVALDEGLALGLEVDLGAALAAVVATRSNGCLANPEYRNS